MTVQAKFFVTTIKHLYTGSPDDVMAEIELQAVTSTNEGNQSWSKWTPSGSLKMVVTNPDAIAEFALGDPFTLTFEKASD